MTREEYESMSAAQLKNLAKERGIKGISALRKADVINALESLDSAAGGREESSAPKSLPKKEQDSSAAPQQRRRTSTDHNNRAQSQGRKQEGSQRPAAKAEGSQRPVAETCAKVCVREDLRRPAGNTWQPEGAQRPAARAEGTGQERRGCRLARPGQPAAETAARRTETGGRTQRPAAPMTRGELRQTNPQPRSAERTETLQDRVEGDRPPMELKQLDSGNTVSGVLEVMADGYGFIRSNNYLPGEDDIYVSPSQIRRFNLKTGDIICGNTRVHAQQEKFSALLFVKTINGYVPSEAAKRYNFDEMTPVFPNERLRMERTGREIAMRIVDILSPIGKGQRGLIVSPPKAGKTTLLKDIARSIQRNNPEMHIIIMLIDERPEEVTDIREAIVGENVEVLDSTFDETPEHHKRVAEMGIERARRLVEHKRDVVILLDSITRLARAYNLIVPPSGRTLSGGLDPAALHPPKRFFGAARNMREGGSLTILATALVDTGSKMDDVVYEEFKGTGNMELILDRKLSERRVFPAIDIMKSGTRREDLLLTTDEGEASYVMRRAMNGMKGEDAVERILDMFARTRSNEELVQRIKHSHII